MEGRVDLDAKSTASASKQYADDAITVNWLDLRVGRIISATKHETAEKLYCESIDVGEAERRSIASGLVPYYSLDEMQNRLVVVVCNLKSRNLVGFPSNGMVLCASSEPSADGSRQVELLCPPPGAKPGDRVFAPNIPGEIVTPQKCDKKKIFPKVAVDLKVNENGHFMWDGTVLSVGDLPKGEACTAPSLRNTEVA
jgi:methionine--tRNA ligase beta chain